MNQQQNQQRKAEYPRLPIANQRPRFDSKPPKKAEPRAFSNVTVASGFQQALQDALDQGYVLNLHEDVTLDQPVEVRITQSHTCWHGLNGNYFKILSKVSGGPAIKVLLDGVHGVCARSLMMSNFSIFCDGNEDGALVIDDSVGDSWIVNPLLQNIWIEGAGGKAGLTMAGNVFEGNLYSVGTMNCKGNGAYFANRGGGAVLSALRWFGGTNRQNGGHGVLVDAYDGPSDIRYYGLYFCENGGAGISTIAGLELASGCGFENNHGGDAIYFENYAHLHRCTASTWGAQPTLVRGYAVNPTVLDDCSIYNYGGGEECLANINKGADIGRVNLNNCGSNQVVKGSAEFNPTGNTTLKGQP